MNSLSPTAPDAQGARGAYGPFAYLNAPNAPLYRRVMKALMAQKERFAVHVRPEQVVLALAVDGGDPVTADAVAELLAADLLRPRPSTPL